jgi:hypothetical protein
VTKRLAIQPGAVLRAPHFGCNGTASFSKRTEWCGDWECLGKSIVLAQFHGPANCVVGHQAYALNRLRWSARTGVLAAWARKRKHDCGAFGTESFYSPNSVDGKRRSTGRPLGANAFGKGRLRGSRMRVSNFPSTALRSSHHPGRLVLFSTSLSLIISLELFR